MSLGNKSSMIPIVTCTVSSPSLSVFETSVRTYCPDVELIISRNMATNFGESFNIAVNEAFTKYDEIIVANDDIVLHPTTYIKLLEDVAVLKQRTKIGWVVAKSDNVRPLQDIRNHPDDAIFEVPIASPLFGYISKQAWINYPPLNWFSDDIQCLDIAQKGFKHFVSRAYVHHVGSSTIGSDNIKNKFASESWIKAHRPDLHKLWFSAAPRKAGLYI